MYFEVLCMIYVCSDEQLDKYLKDEDAVVMIDRYISRLNVVSN